MDQPFTILLEVHNTPPLLRSSAGSLYQKRKLNDAVEECLIQQATSLPRRMPMHLQVKLPATEGFKADEVVIAIHHHFFVKRNHQVS